MNLKWVEIGFRAVPYVIAAVQAVERFVKGRGQEKQDAAVAMVETMVLATEGISGKELLDNTKVQAAVRETIDAVVALQNVIASVKASKT
jgi:hypothetical protein